jgi:hypothetical protein
MKYLKLNLLAVLLVAIFAIGKTSAKEVVVPKMYMFAFAASFTDTIVYFTNVMEVDSVWIQSKNKFLIGRDAYSRQFREYLSEKKQMPNRTCVVFFDKNRKKAEKKYLKLKRLYTQSKDGGQHFDVRYLDDNEFQFKHIDTDAYIVSEEERIAHEKEQAVLVKQQKEAARQQRIEDKKRRKEAKKNKEK